MPSWSRKVKCGLLSCQAGPWPNLEYMDTLQAIRRQDGKVPGRVQALIEMLRRLAPTPPSRLYYVILNQLYNMLQKNRVWISKKSTVLGSEYSIKVLCAWT